ncbi:hypothetical protein D3C80_1168840 [compost metagenome]
MAATSGLSSRVRRSRTSGRFGVAKDAGLPNSVISAPAQNSPEAPKITMARTEGSLFACSHACSSAARSGWPRALTGGRARPIRARLSST